MARAPKTKSARVQHGEVRRLGDLKAHPRNSREHPQEQIDQIAAAMEAWDWTIPLLVDEGNVIIAGHGRWLAGKQKFGEDYQAPVSVAVGWTEDEKRAYVIADNKLTEQGRWNESLLKAEISELSGVGFKLEAMGFTLQQADAILKPPPAPPVRSSKVGSPVISYNVVFDDAAQQQRWFRFVRKLKAEYAGNDSVASKLNRFLLDQMGEAPASTSKAD